MAFPDRHIVLIGPGVGRSPVSFSPNECHRRAVRDYPILYPTCSPRRRSGVKVANFDASAHLRESCHFERRSFGTPLGDADRVFSLLGKNSGFRWVGQRRKNTSPTFPNV